jgi:hypothetical protein
MRPREVEAGAECLPIAMDIGKDRQQHISSMPILSVGSVRDLTDIKQRLAGGARQAEERTLL